MYDAFGHPQSVVVLGGTSDIAREVVKLMAAQRCRTIVLAGRDMQALERTAGELARTVTNVATVAFGATATDGVEKIVNVCFEAAGEPVDLVIMAVGELGNQEEDESDPDRVAQMLTVNVTWPAAALTAITRRLQQQGHGRIVVLSSVAGYRVRRSNFIYGAAKAGLDGFALGLSEAVRGTGISVHVVRPGFVHTKMTAGRPAAPLAVGPERVASDVIRGLARGETVIWSPGALKYVFSILRLLPQALWRRMPG
ncbi:MAG TPA: SDR family NAD(P)-dependent oxidoreductase [Acidimicrobiales bacterium]|jgi:decaprenylphospho-beta-D-erythro-pentofuranosid-2-ulose 2-reductase|nr:SDR family NAD(P)-dependent oxidoreductase [Acidimicrobiales bacterium]